MKPTVHVARSPTRNGAVFPGNHGRRPSEKTGCICLRSAAPAEGQRPNGVVSRATARGYHGNDHFRPGPPLSPRPARPLEPRLCLEGWCSGRSESIWKTTMQCSSQVDGLCGLGLLNSPDVSPATQKQRKMGHQE